MMEEFIADRKAVAPVMLMTVCADAEAPRPRRAASITLFSFIAVGYRSGRLVCQFFLVVWASNCSGKTVGFSGLAGNKRDTLPIRS
jgi:hypothetical protein